MQCPLLCRADLVGRQQGLCEVHRLLLPLQSLSSELNSLDASSLLARVLWVPSPQPFAGPSRETGSLREARTEPGQPVTHIAGSLGPGTQQAQLCLCSPRPRGHSLQGKPTDGHCTGSLHRAPSDLTCPWPVGGIGDLLNGHCLGGQEDP